MVYVRPDDRIPAKDAEVFRVTALACAWAGWEFRRAGTIDPVVRANVRWLSRYRHRRCHREPEAAGLLEAFSAGRPLLAGEAQVGDPVAAGPPGHRIGQAAHREDVLHTGHLVLPVPRRLPGPQRWPAGAGWKSSRCGP